LIGFHLFFLTTSDSPPTRAPRPAPGSGPARRAL
jgi:hypothetical protein